MRARTLTRVLHPRCREPPLQEMSSALLDVLLDDNEITFLDGTYEAGDDEGVLPLDLRAKGTAEVRAASVLGGRVYYCCWVAACDARTFMQCLCCSYAQFGAASAQCSSARTNGRRAESPGSRHTRAFISRPPSLVTLDHGPRRGQIHGAPKRTRTRTRRRCIFPGTGATRPQ